MRPTLPLASLSCLVFAAPCFAQATSADLARVQAMESARVRLIERLAPSVVCIFPKSNRNGGGSGVLIHPDGYGLTNYHVVASLGGRDGEGGRSDGKLYPLEVLGFDPAGDIAMFRLRGMTSFPWAPLGDSAELSVGDWTLAMGNPFLLAEDYFPTVTSGIVSGLHRYLAGSGRALIYTDCIEIDTSINPGNSGGPLFNMAGEVVGINGRIGIEERGRVNVGVGYAISANQIKRFIPALRAGLITRHATLGATVFEKSFGVIMVDQILESSDAYRAGLRLRDRILKFNDEPIQSANQLMNLVGAFPADWPVRLTLRRGDETKAISFRLEALPLPRTPQPPKGLPPDVLRRMPKPPTEPNWSANTREVRRILDRANLALGGPQATRAVASWTIKATARPAPGKTAGETPAQETTIEESRTNAAALSSPAESVTPTAMESAVRWSLLDPPARPRRSRWKVVRADEMAGRIVAVVEHSLEDGPTLEMSFDDENGQFLRLSFQDKQSGKRVRYDYSDFRRAGALRLPHRRTLFLDDAEYSRTTIARYDIRTQTEPPASEPSDGASE